MKLLVIEPTLKPKYKEREFWWNIWFKVFFSKYAEIIWKDNALVQFPLKTDIAIGDVRYYYYEFGYRYVKNYIIRYNHIIADRLRGEENTIDREKFHVQTIFTDEDAINEQLESEMISLMGGSIHTTDGYDTRRTQKMYEDSESVPMHDTVDPPQRSIDVGDIK